MRVSRIYAGPDGNSHFEDLDVPLDPADYGSLSKVVQVQGLVFRETPVGGTFDYHRPGNRQFVVTLSGLAEIEASDGTKRRFGAGDIMLADDTTGKGHITRDIEGPRRSLFILLSPDVDVSRWKA
jgi:hypothetical protein